MFSIIRNMFGGGPDLAELVKDGAKVVDVRSRSEFQAGHVKGAINIPLDQLGSNVKELKNFKHIILCCQSGARSGMGEQLLKSKGLTNVVNGGGWRNVERYFS